mgnify:CR=1 FL=1
MKNISILGSTGSVGKQALEIVKNNNKFQIDYLYANSNYKLLYEQILIHTPKYVCINNIESYNKLLKLDTKDTNIVCGVEDCIEFISSRNVDLALNAIVGISGLKPTLAILESKTKLLALSNKESIVQAGHLVMKLAQSKNVNIFPVDSEHSALWQCMVGEEKNKIRKIILTASGGPFRELPEEEFSNITVKQALNHPNWEMGQKITIDSATMMNKGFEMIEAYWLFSIDTKNIEIVIHPQSIIHSMVEYIDGSIKAQHSNPDMRLPIQYALSYPDRYELNDLKFDIEKFSKLDIKPIDLNKFKCVKLAFEAINFGGSYPVVLNISNDLAVDLFLNEKISFIQFYLFYFRYFRQILKQVKIKKFYHLKIMKLI